METIYTIICMIRGFPKPSISDHFLYYLDAWETPQVAPSGRRLIDDREYVLGI